MSLTVLVLVVGLGIAAIVAAVHFTGGSARRRFSSTDEAVSRFHLDFPETEIGGVSLANEGETAFLTLENFGIGLVQNIGARFLTRKISSSDIRSMELRNHAALWIEFNDFTFRGGLFRFADQSSAQTVLERLMREKSGERADATE